MTTEMAAQQRRSINHRIAAHQMHRQGKSAESIAITLDVTTRSVHRYLEKPCPAPLPAHEDDEHDLASFYLQLMSSGKRVESRQNEVAEFSRNLKLLAKELDVPVVALSQLNRGPEQRIDKLPQLSDLRETGQLEQDADMVILIHRPDVYDRDSPRMGEADLILAKQRNGPAPRTFPVSALLHLSQFSDMPRGWKGGGA